MSINGKGRPQTPGFAIGTQFKYLQVEALAEPGLLNGYPHLRYLMRCICGRTIVRTKSQIYKKPDTQCLVCAGKKRMALLGTDGRSHTPEWAAWTNMRKRCENPNAQAYYNYGARGITVCKRWQSFDNFLADMGPRPEGLTLERRKNHLGYRPSNCYWATPAEQNRNTRANRWLTVRGETKVLADWARTLGTTAGVVSARIDKRKWSVEDACTIPVAGRHVKVKQESKNGV